MIRTLLIITGAGLVLCIAALSGAAALGGSDLARHGWEWTVRDGDRTETITIERQDRGPSVSRAMTWTGGDRLVVDLPGEVVFTQGDAAEVSITGPEALVQRVQLVDGRLTLAPHEGRVIREGSAGSGPVSARWSSRAFPFEDVDRLRITITAPSVTAFDLTGSADLVIRGYDQPTFMLDVSGSGDVDAAGQTQTAVIEIDGSGDSDLSALRVADARVDVSGSGDVRVGPTGSARVDISGSGDVELTSRPANLQQSVSGSGDIDMN